MKPNRKNPRVYIRRGELHSGYEPNDLPGAYILLRFAVKDSLGVTPPTQITWDGPAEWITSRDGVPKGYRALWLGTREATRPFVVFVADEPTKGSDLWEKAYRKGFKAKRVFPKVSDSISEDELDAMRQGWQDGRRHRMKQNPSVDASRHQWLAKQHRMMASAITSRDAASMNRRTAHEYAAEAHERAASGRGSSDAAYAASRHAHIDPYTFGMW